MWITFVIDGYLAASLDQLPTKPVTDEQLEAVHYVVISGLSFAWAAAYAKEQNSSISWVYKTFAGIWPIFGVPAFFLRLFGSRKALRKIALTIVFLFICALGFLFPYGLVVLSAEGISMGELMRYLLGL
jgi:hypothetical protein